VKDRRKGTPGRESKETVHKFGLKGKILTLIKGIHEKLTASIIRNGEILNNFPLRLGAGKDVHCFHFYSTLH
jgi:hypothetical protein